MCDKFRANALNDHKSAFLCSGILPQAEPAMVDVDLETPATTEHIPGTISDAKEEKTTIGKL